MPGAIEKIRKRRRYRMKIADEELDLRAMKYAEIDRATALGATEEGDGFVLGLTLLEADGSQVWTQSPADGNKPAETDKEFGLRVITEADAYTDVIAEIAQAVFKISRAAALDSLVKNS